MYKRVLFSTALILGWVLVASALVRGTPAGAPAVPGDLDPTFGAGGVVTATFGTANSYGGLALQPDGKLVLAGSSGSPGPGSFILARYSPTGQLDPSFDGDGVVTTDFTGNGSFAYAVRVTAGAQIVAAGRALLSPPPNPSGSLGLARFNPDGSLDSGFGTGGKVITHISPDGNSRARDFMFDATGRLVVAAYQYRGTINYWALVRYTENGSLVMHPSDQTTG
jgi:uncharacterized delta-60 repeat protein